MEYKKHTAMPPQDAKAAMEKYKVKIQGQRTTPRPDEVETTTGQVRSSARYDDPFYINEVVTLFD